MIDGDADFTPANGVVGGNGTWDDPFIIEGWEIAAPYSTAILIKNTNAHFVIRDVHVHPVTPGSYHSANVFLRNLTNGAIRDSVFSDALINLDRVWNVNLTGNSMSGTQNEGIEVNSFNYPPSTNITIVSNDISDSLWNGISLSGFAPPYPGHIDIVSNTVTGSGLSCIKIDYPSSNSVQHLNITSNTLSDCSSDGINIQSKGVALVKDFNVSSNIILNNSLRGIYASLEGTSTTPGRTIIESVDMRSNIVSGNSKGGISLAFSDSSTPEPISVLHSSIVLNEISNNSGTGIQISAWRTKANSSIDVSSNTILGNAGEGVYADLQDDRNVKVTLVSNIVANNSANGIRLERSNKASVTSNTVTGNLNNGIDVLSAVNANLSSNTISNNSRTGLHLSGCSDVSISQNTLYGNQRHGIFIEASTRIDVLSNTIKKSQYYAIYLGPPPSTVINTKVRIISNTVAWNDRGIILNICNETLISDNQVSHSSFAIQLVDRANNTLITGNTATDSVYGIHIKSSVKNRIYHNMINNNTGQGRDDKGPENSWDDGYPNAGNHWSDYPGHDYFSGPNQDVPGSDGIGDTPYVIDADTRDSYPLVSWSGFHAPTVNITSPPADAWSNSTTVGIAGTADDDMGDLSRVEVSCDGGVRWKTANGAASWTYSCAGLANGPNTIKARAFDLQDSVSVPFETVVNVDAVPPVVRIDSPADGEWFNTAIVNVSGTAADAGIGLDRVEVSCNGGLSWDTAAGSQSWTCSCYLATGANFIESRSFDKGGLESSHHRIRVNIDLNAPHVSIKSPLNGTWFGVTTVTVSGTAADSGGIGLDRVEVSCDGNMTWQVATGKTSWTTDCTGLVEGTNTVLARAFDLKGHESPSDMASIEVDLTPPSVDFASPRDGQWFGVTYAVVNGSASDDGGSGPTRVEVSCDNSATWHAAAGIPSWAFNCTGLAEGPNIIHSRAFDLVGWESAHVSITINVNLTLPLVVIMSPGDGGWIRTGTVAVSGVASSNLNGLYRIEVSCNGGYSWNAATGTGSWLYTCINLAEGANSIDARAFDTGGYESPHDAIVVNRDSIPPDLELMSPSNGAWFNSTTVHVSGTARDAGSGVEKIEVSCDDGTSWVAATGTSAWSSDCIALTEGANTLRAKAVDAMGWASEHMVTTANVDLTPPIVAITSPVYGTWTDSSTVILDGTATDLGGSGIAGVDASCDGGSTWLAVSGAASWIGVCTLNAGANIVLARAFDKVGWPSSIEGITVNVDMDPPTVGIDSPLDGSWLNTTTLVVKGDSSDVGSGLDRVEVSCDGGISWTNAAGILSWSSSCTLEPGANAIAARAFDKTQRESLHDIVVVDVDLLPPTLTILSPVNGARSRDSTVIVSGTAIDGGGSGLDKVEVSCDGGTTWNTFAGTGYWEHDCVILSEGSVQVEARASDIAGWRSSTATAMFIVDITPPTLTIASPANNTTTGSSSEVLSGTASDNDGVASVRVRIGTGGWFDAIGSGSWSATLALYPGNNAIQAQAVDLAGNPSLIETLLVFYDIADPSVAIDCGDAAPVIGSTMTCLITASDNRGTPSVAWNVTKGGTLVTSGTGFTAKFTIGEAGVHKVLAVATDGVGRARIAVLTIHVAAQPEAKQNDMLWLAVAVAIFVAVAIILDLSTLRARRIEAMRKKEEALIRDLMSSDELKEDEIGEDRS